jgi:two-component system chemotaxis response regulator CheY
MKLLLVEDNAQNAEIYLRVLRERGHHEVIHSLNGLDGLLAARQAPFDAILIDFDLPDVHGLQVGVALYHLMRRKRIKQAPLIALTAQSDKATQVEAGRVGFAAFIAKPCTEDDLLETVRQLALSVKQP